MELTPPEWYRVRNGWGSGIVDRTEAERVFTTWLPDQRSGDLDAGFTVWHLSELGGTLGVTEYEPIADS